MQLAKCFIVFVVLIGKLCSSKIIIHSDKSNGFAELEAAAVRTLTTCYTKHDKTIVLVGDFPGHFIEKLSAYQHFSLVVLDGRRRAENNVDYWYKIDAYTTWKYREISRKHKIHVAVIVAGYFWRFLELLSVYRWSSYYTSETFVLILSWSPGNMHGSCDGYFYHFQILDQANANDLLNANLMCNDRRKGIVMYTSNFFINQAPQPWRQLIIRMRPAFRSIAYFVREYREHEELCKNLYFDKTRDLGGSPITTLYMCSNRSRCSGIPRSNPLVNIRKRIERSKRFDFIANFIAHLNATRRYEWKYLTVGQNWFNVKKSILTQPFYWNEVRPPLCFTYPHGVDCKFLVTQFRGNKTQLTKILTVIDHYSRIGMLVVYIISLIFFKYFLRRPLSEAIMNLSRLTCNFGLTTLPSNVSPRIYLGCLFFFVITMQGIFSGNLAALLTHEFPVRQVNSIQDLADFGHTIYVHEMDLRFFKDSVFKGRLILRRSNEDCIQFVKRHPLIACVTWSAEDYVKALDSNLHVSSTCIHIENVVSLIPCKWPLEKSLHKFLLITFASDTMLNLEMLVHEKRLLEAEMEEVPLEPEIMTLEDLSFAFIIFGIGLSIALICFIVEIMIYRYHHRVVTTRGSRPFNKTNRPSRTVTKEVVTKAVVVNEEVVMATVAMGSIVKHGGGGGEICV